MAVREDVKQTRKRGSEPKGQGSAERDTAEPATNAEDQGRVDGVREILFGAQREEYDRRFNRLEELLVKSTSDLSNDITKKISGLREEYDQRFARLEELLVKNISDLGNDTTKKLGALRDEYDQRFARLEELLLKNVTDLSSDTARKLDALKDEFDKSLAKNVSNLNNDIQGLSQGKVDKAAVSKLLEKVVKLSHDLNVADVGDSSRE